MNALRIDVGVHTILHVNLTEVAFYELHLSLNELGNAFLTSHKKLNELKIYKEVESSIRENHEYIDLETVFKNKHPFKE